MKHFMLRSLMLLSVLLSSLGISTAWAQLEGGKVYNFANLGSTGNSMTFTGMSDVSVATTNTEDVAQLWYVIQNQDKSYSLRNLATGKYLRSSNATSNKWTLVNTIEDNCKFNIYTAGNGYTLRATNTTGDYNYMHYGASNGAVVCWEINATATHWGFNKVEIPTEDLQETFNNLSNLSPEQATINSYQQALDNLFEDKGCTILKSAYQTEDALTASSHYQDLPAKLQAMALKVCGGEWTENNYDSNKSEWDSDYAKKYRVQLYEPYNEPEAAASALGLNAHTNLNNPTGIFGGAGEPIYVMVDGTIDEGASLYITYYTGHGKLSGYSYGFELHTGLNVIPSYVNGTNFCINYVVHTFDTSKGKGNKAKARKLSGYKDLKIHIEGGYINGYYNKMGDDLYTPDKNADWDYIAARATQKDVTILGKYITLQFPLNDADTEGNKGLGYYLTGKNLTEAVIDEWDNVMLWERLLLGVLDKNTINAQAKKSPYSIKNVFEYTGEDGEFESDYSDYYNVHGLSFGVGGNSYMYGSWDHCGYHYNTMESIIQNLLTNAGSHWGPGHEIGHQHQELLNMRGLTEVTNNLFSNVVLWYFGETTSRYNGSEGALSEVLKQFNAEGTDFFSNNIWGQTIMYYKLFLYYHVLGHNPKFYPLLFEMLRQDPMTIGYDQDGSKCLMHFYKKCCLAAGEDLTEFFRAHGFFEVMDNRYVGDYSNAVYNLTQAQINAAIAEVKAQAETNGWKENIAVLFITDATRETIKSHKGDNLTLYGETTICAEVGSYSTFNNNEAANYTYSISGTTVTMEGTGGVGFAILNENGELLGFSDKKTFEISAEAAAAIASGEASIVTLKGDNTQVATTNVMDAGDNETKYELLGNLLDDAKALLDLSDETGTNVGYYRTSALTDLQTAYTTAKGVYDEKTVVAYSAVYDVLFQEYANIINNEYARINITEGYAYRLTNKAYPERSMAVNTENHQMFGIATAESDAQLWYFEPGATKGTYYLKNKSTNKYPGDASSGAVLSANKSEADKGNDNGAYAYRLQSMGNGIFALVGSKALHCSSSQSYNIVGWGADAAASQWYITATALDEALEARTKLEELIGKTEALINEMADVQIKGNALDLSTCTITSNATETGHETKYLIDGNTSTFFHTVWSGTAVQAHHNIVVDLGEENSLEQFALNYITSNAANVDAPTAMVVEGSNDGTNYATIATLNDLPTAKTAQYTSATLGTKGTPYRYIRLRVTSATGGKLGGYYYFGMAELGLTNMQTVVHSVQPEYSASRTAIIDACDEYYTASLTYNNGSAEKAELDAATEALSEKYNALLAAYNNVKNASLDAKKAELQKLIDDANTLIDECGDVTYTPATFNGEATLQTENSTGNFYVSTNADQNTGGGKVDGGGIAALVDNNYNTYFHTRWEGTKVYEPHYFQVDLGEDIVTNKFTFSYKPRNGSPAPSAMKIYGSNDGSTFTDVLAEITNGLPLHNAGQIYESATITTSQTYRYLRFTVTKSEPVTGGNAVFNNQYFFGLLEFDLNLIGSPESYKVVVDEGMGEVDEALMLETYHEVAEAQSTITYATTEAQLDKAIAQLQAQHDALLEAKNNQYAQDLQVKIEETEALIAECGRIENGEVVEVFETAGDATKQQILDAYNQVAEANELINASGATPEQYVEATNALEALRAALATAKAGTVKSTLRTLTNEVAALITLCGTTLGDVSEVMLDDLTTANQEALTLLQGDDLTDIAEKTTALQAQYTTVATAQQATGKSTLSRLIAEMATLISDCTTGEGENLTYVGDVTEELLTISTQAKDAAQAVVNANNTTTADFETATETLQGYYDTLLAAKNSTAKASLRAKIAQLAELIEKCHVTGTNIVTRSEVCTLQADNSSADFYISTNATDSEGEIRNLVDGDTNTFFQTKSSVGVEHYLLVDAGENNKLKKFTFSYRPCKSPFPYTIVVEGSNDNSEFTELATFTDLPTTDDQNWESSEIGNGTAYRYLRFNITKSGVAIKVDDNKKLDTSVGEQLSNKYKSTLSAATPQVEYCFAMSDFKLTNFVEEEEDIEILAGTVTEDQLTVATSANTAAETLANTSAVKAELEAKTGELQTLYDALYAAYGLKVTLTLTDATRDKLLTGIDLGRQTIGTFSACYATLIPDGVTAYYATQEYSGGIVWLTRVETTVLPANQGVILIGEEDYVNFYPAAEEPQEDLSQNIFSNTASGPVTSGSADYILANGREGIGIYKAKEGITIGQFKAFIRLDAAAATQKLVLRFGGTTTDVDNVPTVILPEDTIYDLSGRRVNEVTKGGVYIVNGKKVFIK